MSDKHRERLIDPLKVREKYGLTFEHLHYYPVPPDDITRFVTARRQAIVDLLQVSPEDEHKRADIIKRTRQVWEGTAAADLDDIAALAIDLEATLARVIGELQREQPDLQLDRFLLPAAKDERMFHLEGTMQELLFRYRDLSQRLTEDAHASALQSMRKGVAQLDDGFQLFSQFAFDELSFSARHWAEHLQVMAGLRALVQRYERTYAVDLGSISGRDDDDKVWREFMMACALACLRCYGFAPNWAVQHLLARKSDGYKYQLGCPEWPGNDRDSIKRRVNEQVAQARRRALKIAASEQWPTRPVIEFTASKEWVRSVNQRPNLREEEFNLDEPDLEAPSRQTAAEAFALQGAWMGSAKSSP